MRYPLFCRLAMGCIALVAALGWAFSAGEAPRRAAPTKHKRPPVLRWAAPSPYALRWHDGGWPVRGLSRGGLAMPSAFATGVTPAQVTFTLSGFPSAYSIPYPGDPSTIRHFRNVTGMNRAETCAWNSSLGIFRYSSPAPTVSWQEMDEVLGVPGSWSSTLSDTWSGVVMWTGPSACRIVCEIGPGWYPFGMGSDYVATTYTPPTGAFTPTPFTPGGPVPLITLSGWSP